MASILLQKALEKRANGTALRAVIKDMVEAMSFSTVAKNNEEFISSIGILDVSHKEVHLELLKTVTESHMRLALRTLMYENLVTKSYLDRNVLAYKIGQKIVDVKSTVGKETNLVSYTLSLGLTVLHLCSINHFISYEMRTRLDNKAISSIRVNNKLYGDDVKELEAMALDIRANRFMIIRPLSHSGNKVGGSLGAPSTMLKSGLKQPDIANVAINKLQEVAYTVRTSYNNHLMELYSTSDKWYNEKGIFQAKEWKKFISDYKLASEAEAVYFPFGYDDRGRMYDRSGYIKIQGDEFTKSLLEFREKEKLTLEGERYLKIAIANELYTDKCTEDQAIEWFDSKSSEELDELAKDSPIAWTLVQDYKIALTGAPIGTIVHWDATNSGLQIYSLIGKDRETGKLCNVFNTGIFADAYQALANMLNKLTDTNKFNRSNVKKAFMTFLYGSMMNNILNQIEDPNNGVTKGIGEFFPQSLSDKEKWTLFTESMEQIAPAAIKLMEIIFSFKDENKTKYNWVMPDGFKVETTMTVTYCNRDDDKDNKRPAIRGWFMDKAGKTHEGSISVIVEEYDELSRALAPNVIHSIDSYIARLVISRCDFPIHFIHDSFGVHPNNVNKLRQIVREVYAEIADSNILIDILSQLDPVKTGALIQRGLRNKTGGLQFGDLTKLDVLESKYILR